MIFIFFLFLILKFFKNIEGGVVNPQALRYDPVPYLASRGQLINKNASGARIISRDPFIISLELPDKDPKDLGQTKRKKITKKRNRLRREIQGEDDVLERSKRCSRMDWAQRKRDLQPIEKKPIKINKHLKHRKNFKKGAKSLHVPDITENATSEGNQCPILLADDHTLDDLINDIKKIKEKLQILLAHISSHEISEEVPEARFDGSNNGIENTEPIDLKYISTVAEDIEVLQKKIKYISDLVNGADEKLTENINEPSKSDSPVLDLLQISEEVPYVYELLREPENEKTTKTNDQVLIRDKIKYLQDILKSSEIKNRKKRETDLKPRSRKKRCPSDNTPVVSKSQNKERYKVKKWEEDLKLKRSQSKCPCGMKNNECAACRCSKCQKCRNKQSNIDKLIEASEEAQNYLESTFLENYPEENVLNWSKKSRSPVVLDPFVEDLTLYRQRAKQILKNAQEILKRLKETEEQWAPKSGDGYLESSKWGDIIGMNPRKYGDNDVEDLVLELIYKVGKRLQEVREGMEADVSEDISEESEEYMEAEETSNQEEAEEKDEKLKSSHQNSSGKHAKESEEEGGSKPKTKKQKDHHAKHAKSQRKRPLGEDIKEILDKFGKVQQNDPNLEKTRDRDAKPTKSSNGKSPVKESPRNSKGEDELQEHEPNMKQSRDHHLKKEKNSSGKPHLKELAEPSESDELRGKDSNLKNSRDQNLKLTQKSGEESIEPSPELHGKDLSQKKFRDHLKQVKNPSQKSLEETLTDSSQKSAGPEEKDLHLKKSIDRLLKHVQDSSGKHQEEKSAEPQGKDLNSERGHHSKQAKNLSGKPHSKALAESSRESEELNEKDANLKKIRDLISKHVQNSSEKHQPEESEEGSQELHKKDSNLRKDRNLIKALTESSQESSEPQVKNPNLEESIDRLLKHVQKSSGKPQVEESSEPFQESQEFHEKDSTTAEDEHLKNPRDRNLKHTQNSSKKHHSEESAEPSQELDNKDSNLKKSRDHHSTQTKNPRGKSKALTEPSSEPEESHGKDLILEKLREHVQNPNGKSQLEKLAESSQESGELYENDPNLKKSRDRHLNHAKSGKSRVEKTPGTSQESEEPTENDPHLENSRDQQIKLLKSSSKKPNEEPITATPEKSEELKSDDLEKLIDLTKKQLKSSSKKPPIKDLTGILQKSEEQESSSNLKMPVKLKTKNFESFSEEESLESELNPSLPKTSTLPELLKLPGTDVMRDHRDNPPKVESDNPTLTTEPPSEDSSNETNENLEASNLGLNSTNSVEKLMDDFEEGKMDEEDMKTIKKLDDEKINNLIDQIDEAEDDEGEEGEEGEEDEEDCDYIEPECDCGAAKAEDVDKYEIMKSFLLWIKEMHMDNVLSS